MNDLLPSVWELKEADRDFPLRDFAPEGAPLEIEIGCGNGRFLAANAAKRPDVRFIGVERMIDRLRKCSRKARQGALHNLLFVRVEAGRFVRELLPDACCQALYLFFPDPWPKRRHHKNRFFRQPMCDTLARILTPGGRFFLSTDHEDYYLEIYRWLSADPRFEEIPPLVRPEDEQTDFERLFLAKGDPIHDCAFRLRGPDAH